MASEAECEQCRTIRDQLREALADIEAAGLAQEMRAAHDAARKMVGGDEHDVQRAEEVLAAFRAQSSAFSPAETSAGGPFGQAQPEESRPPIRKLHAAFRASFEHGRRTGHKMAFPE